MTHIGRHVVINGEFTSDEDLQMDGTITGDMQIRDATLTIGETGKVEADIYGARVVVHGMVRGSITASARIELGPAASVEGNLSADQVVIAEGARFQGRIDMARRTVAIKMAQYKADQAAAGASR
ncbi:MAG TPA: polymer-forming cytoskeletal protein [Vicinamibacterales bacterium]|nr:polymer-forming cytoskeletal protein [Vicinamibacterales bacterium]